MPLCSPWRHLKSKLWQKVWPTKKTFPSFPSFLHLTSLLNSLHSVPSHFLWITQRCPFSFQLPALGYSMSGKIRARRKKTMSVEDFIIPYCTSVHLIPPFSVVKPPPKQNLAPLYLLMSSDVRAYTHTLIPKCVEWDSLAGQSCISFCKILMCGYSHRNFTWVVHVTTCGMHL